MRAWALAVAGLVVSLVACAGERPPQRPAPETERAIASGRIVGKVAENGAHVWLGIPYAASPAGSRRWRAPRPASPWSGVRQTIRPAQRCAQLTNEFDSDEGLEPGLVIGTEDCLTLDVYAPPGRGAEPLPVMVWIHGGGNVWGRSSAYDGSRLASNEDVLVVAVQYRLGPLGWMSHELLRSSATQAHDAAASFALLDLIAALGWIRENIAAFGGDPRNVTIFGESAGGHNVVALLASPRARGLFHRAIVQSGSFDGFSIAEAEGDEGTQANASKTIVEKLGVESAEALRALPLETLFAAYEYERGFLDAPRMIEDDVVLPAGGLRAAFTSTRTFANVPIALGTNRDEMKLFYLRDPEMTRRQLGLLLVARDPDFYDALTEALSRLWRIRAVDEPAATMHAAGHERVYAYRFDWDDAGRFLSMDLGRLLGAAHGFELPFVFNRFVHLGNADRLLFLERTAADRERLSRAMGSYWASFARDGEPSWADGPAWPVYGGDASFLRLDTANDGGIEVVARAESLEDLARDLRDDPRLDAAGRCRVVDEMGEWSFGRPVQERLRNAVGCGAGGR